MVLAIVTDLTFKLDICLLLILSVCWLLFFFGGVFVCFLFFGFLLLLFVCLSVVGGV